MKRKFLLILPWLPYPLKSGGHQALFNGIAAIKDDFDIYIAYEAWVDEKYKEAEQEYLNKIPQTHLLPLLHEDMKGCIPTFIRVLRKIKRCAYNFLNYKTHKKEQHSNYTSEKWWVKTVSPLPPDFLEHVNRICKKWEFDIIQVEMPWMTSQILTLPEGPIKFYVHHELGFIRRELEIKEINSEYAKACKRFADLNEIAQLNLYDAIITLSSIDMQKLKDAGVSRPIFTSFATINTSAELEVIIGNGKTLSFIGPDSHKPNFVGITWFLENCWEKLKVCDNEYHLNIIGNWSERNCQDYSEKYPGVSFLGYVPDLQSILRGTIMIVPITIGSGIRMKILEACSNGVPFVSTFVGAEGIPLENGKDCFITDDPNEFVEDILKLQAPELQRQFIVNANKMVCKHYNLEALRRNRMNIYEVMLEQMQEES